MKVSLLQMNIAFQDPEENIKTLRRLMEEAMVQRPDTVLLPELWNIGFYPKPSLEWAGSSEAESRQVLSELAARYQVNIVGGSIATLHGDEVRNTCCVLDRSGTLVASYDKTHLFSPMEEDEDFCPGDRLVVFSLDSFRCAVAICYDIRFPELIRRLALEDIDVLFLAAAWPMERLIHWQTLIRARAIENQIFLVAANGAGTFPGGMHLAGHSAIIDPWGEILAEAPEGEAVLHANLKPAIRQQIRESINVFADRRPELYGEPFTR